jgi:hypothetical protein
VWTWIRVSPFFSLSPCTFLSNRFPYDESRCGALRATETINERQEKDESVWYFGSDSGIHGVDEIKSPPPNLTLDHGLGAFWCDPTWRAHTQLGIIRLLISLSVCLSAVCLLACRHTCTDCPLAIGQSSSAFTWRHCLCMSVSFKQRNKLGYQQKAWWPGPWSAFSPP